jgi:protein-disulfide isomerase
LGDFTHAAREEGAYRRCVLRSGPLSVRIVAIAFVVVAVLVSVSLLGARRSSGSSAQVAGVADARALVAGIPQQGFALGNPKARLTIEEFADLQCPYCKKWALEQMPAVVTSYVRTGKVRMVFRPLAFVGPDSVRAARTVVAAGRRNQLWQTVDLLYANQGTENGGWASQSFLDRAVSGLGLEAAPMRAAAATAATAAALDAAQAEATSLGVRSTPTIVFRVHGKAPMTIDPNAAFDPATLSAAIDAALAR